MRSLRRNNMAALRGVLPANAKSEGEKIARKLLEERHPGENLLKFCSEGGETDLALIRSVLTPRVIEIAAKYFLEVAGSTDFFIPYMAQQVRHFDPAIANADAIVPFHQDASVLVPGAKMLNLWTLLHPDECGDSAPGMDFLPVRAGRLSIERNPTSAAYKFLEADHARIEKLERKHPPITPRLKLGDVLAFNELALHRTSLKASTRARVSAEIRLIALTHQAIDFYGNAAATVIYGRIRWASRWKLSEDGRFHALAYQP